MMELVHEMTYFSRLRPPVSIGGPYGHRAFYEVIDGELEGPRIRGTWRAGGDWAVGGSDGFTRLDGRSLLETDDGAFVYTQYEGVLEVNKVLMNALRTGQETAYEDQYFRITARFETGDERYRWLTQSVFVGEGRLYPGNGVEYRVYRVA